jgi:hypothetical protein
MQCLYILRTVNRAAVRIVLLLCCCSTLACDLPLLAVNGIFSAVDLAHLTGKCLTYDSGRFVIFETFAFREIELLDGGRPPDLWIGNKRLGPAPQTVMFAFKVDPNNESNLVPDFDVEVPPRATLNTTPARRDVGFLYLPQVTAISSGRVVGKHAEQLRLSTCERTYGSTDATTPITIEYNTGDPLADEAHRLKRLDP